ncbi:hypothetical protein HK44_014700 [Pseudomonas fluorescens HK44]|uniref:Malonate decarboxylase subunit alpha n=1 Tax=Pseudomonas fluorescens HK44 TaxID=1042209 RepID=A0A010RTG7_PSEFL|nr:hypothetical protein HK44_014700 [Pseudomonas fluorescens HK44]
MVKGLADAVVLPTDKIVAALEALILPGDRVVLEGNNQKQADFLSRSPVKAAPAKLHDLHMIVADKPFHIEPLFTRDPRHIKPVLVLMAMMAIRAIYEKHNVHSLNHGIGFNTAAIELILPTYGESLGLKGKICRNWTLNPHPTLIPAIESG